MVAVTQPRLARQVTDPRSPERQFCDRPKRGVQAIAKVGLPLALAFLLTTTHVEAASRSRRAPRAATLGLVLTQLNDRLIVISTAGNLTGLAAWDHIVAVNGRRVSTESAFMNRVKNTNNGAATVLVNRNGNRISLNLAAGAASGPMNPGSGVAGAAHSSAGAHSASGIINPALLVRTSQGVMHIERARRLGLAGVPIEGSPEWPAIPQPSAPQASGFLNPVLLVLTPQGVMHIERARRLGLPGVPIHGSPEWPPIPK